MLFVNTIQLSHTHVATKLITAKQKNFIKKEGEKSFYSNAIDSKCFICEYQLAKEADPAYASFHFTSPLIFTVTTIGFYSSTPQQQYSFFETRGPPATV